MLSDEERKAIKEVNHFKELTRYWQEEEYEEKEIAGYIETILNLIEKQSKEIEEYKKQLDLDYVDKHFVPIERYNQLKKEIEELKDKNKKLQDKAKELIFEKQELTSALLDSTPNDKIKAKIEEIKKSKENIYFEEHLESILQSLLEKE